MDREHSSVDEPHINTSARMFDMEGIDAFKKEKFHIIPLKTYKFIGYEELA